MIFDGQKIILASQSPRRKQLLEQIGMVPVCMPVDIDESVYLNEMPLEYCNRLALQKAQSGWLLSEKNLPVLGSDTVVVYDDQILGKPKNEQHAIEMLSKLSGRRHQMITAVAVVFAEKQLTEYSISEVQFEYIKVDEIKAYVESGEPMDKAGSYGIQGHAALWIKKITGSHSGIMGLPLFETGKILRSFYE
ncbi:MAG: Maf family protein [Gammaproteobacteria bacterium]|jgi:septum formation protein|nr:septum formation inhibitor Maf [Xanthomonadales bacterium]